MPFQIDAKQTALFGLYGREMEPVIVPANKTQRTVVLRDVLGGDFIVNSSRNGIVVEHETYPTKRHSGSVRRIMFPLTPVPKDKPLTESFPLALGDLTVKVSRTKR